VISRLLGVVTDHDDPEVRPSGQMIMPAPADGTAGGAGMRN
jgi:hypothetical protein